jgi:hypothetical protein
VIELEAALAVPERPEALTGRADLGPRRAEHQGLAVEADVAPALAQAAVAPERHPAGRQREGGAILAGAAPGNRAVRHAPNLTGRHGAPLALYSRRVAQVIQIIGALIILGAFAGSQLGELPTDSRRYLVLNVFGSAILAVLAVVEGQIGFLLLEGVWALVSAWSLFVLLGEEAEAAAEAEEIGPPPEV